MMTLAEVLTTFHLDQRDVTGWMEMAWIRPRRLDDQVVFEDCDVARVQLIIELRELAVDDEALPLVLSLLDQLYTARTALHDVREALSHLPEPMVSDVMRVVERSGER
ncbi:MAG: chaperone modulator CbpM [Rhodospirillales bacterium]|nr:chaperone modulator CbpM [Rhodospirillales bacterium]